MAQAETIWKPANMARVHAQLIVSRALVAPAFPVGAAITHGLEPAMLILLRFALASLLFAPFVYLRHGLALPRPRALAGYAVISGCLVVFFWCMFTALRTTTALNTGAIVTLVPGIAAIYAAILVRERLGAHRMVALGCGLVGALWVVFRGDFDRFASLTLNGGDLIFFAGCLALGLYGPLVKRFHRQEPAAVMTFWVLVMGTGWLVLINHSAIWRMDWGAIDATVFAGIAYLAVFTTIISFYVAQHATLHIGPTRSSSYSYLTPAMVVAIEFLAGKGLPTLAILPGVVVIFVATFVVQRGGKAEEGPIGRQL
jgi:drug/metabolite transporter (DMT)-like permease